MLNKMGRGIFTRESQKKEKYEKKYFEFLIMYKNL